MNHEETMEEVEKRFDEHEEHELLVEIMDYLESMQDEYGQTEELSEIASMELLKIVREFDKNKELKICDCCKKKKKDVEYLADPYDLEILGEVNMLNLCPECYSLLSEDI